MVSFESFLKGLNMLALEGEPDAASTTDVLMTAENDLPSHEGRDKPLPKGKQVKGSRQGWLVVAEMPWIDSVASSQQHCRDVCANGREGGLVIRLW